ELGSSHGGAPGDVDDDRRGSHVALGQPMTNSTLIPFAVALSILAGCDQTRQTSQSAGPSSSAAPSVRAARPDSPAATGSAQTPSDPLLALLQAGPKDSSTTRSETIRDAGGVYAGLPKGYKTSDSNSYKEPGHDFSNDFGHCLFFSGGAPSDVARALAP